MWDWLDYVLHVLKGLFIATMALWVNHFNEILSAFASLAGAFYAILGGLVMLQKLRNKRDDD